MEVCGDDVCPEPPVKGPIGSTCWKGSGGDPPA